MAWVTLSDPSKPWGAFSLRLDEGEEARENKRRRQKQTEVETDGKGEEGKMQAGQNM